MKTLAIIEDNADNRLIVTALLRGHYQVRAYETGGDGLAGLKNEKPDAVLLDISLPGMDGLEVLAAIRQDEELRNLPVIAFTAHAMAGDRDRYLDAGFDDYLAKPIIEEKTLLDTIGRWI